LPTDAKADEMGIESRDDLRIVTIGHLEGFVEYNAPIVVEALFLKRHPL